MCACIYSAYNITDMAIASKGKGFFLGGGAAETVHKFPENCFCLHLHFSHRKYFHTEI